PTAIRQTVGCKSVRKHCHSLNEETKQKQSQYLSAYRFKNSAIPFAKEIKNSILIPTNISIFA
ncbi:hypothetical protein, partial [Bacteroides heparinolyticus]